MPTSILRIAIVLAGFVAVASGQELREPRRAATVDPYTDAVPAAMAKAGYVSFGPFAFGFRHDTEAIEQLLPDEPLLWIETAHFRIGCALSSLPLRGDPEWVDRTKGELKRLKVRLPKIKAVVRELDPWLRTHLIAQRCEDLYLEICSNLSVDDGDFPAVDSPQAPGSDPDGDPRAFRGLGPCLGMPEKFSVLIVQSSASLARYTRAFQGHETQEMGRLLDLGFGNMIFAAAEASQDLYGNDFALHTHLVYNLAFSLYNSYRYHGHELPPWLVGGLSHWHARRVCQRFPTFERRGGADEIESLDAWRWGERAQGLLGNRAFEPLEALMARSDVSGFGKEQHIQAWAFTDFLMSTRQAATMRFLHDLKDPFHAMRRPPSHPELLDRMKKGLVRTFGLDAAGLEAAWRTHLLRGWPKK